MRIVAFIEYRWVVRALLKQLLLWDEPRSLPATSVAASRATVELEYLLGVE
jgi:hypothetical protein